MNRSMNRFQRQTHSYVVKTKAPLQFSEARMVFTIHATESTRCPYQRYELLSTLHTGQKLI